MRLFVDGSEMHVEIAHEVRVRPGELHLLVEGDRYCWSARYVIADLALHRVDRPEDDGRRHDCRVRVSLKRYPDVHRGIYAKECLASRIHIWLRPVRIAGVGNGLQEH